jgi:NAD(P)-dependent dehydrogenase (short-subunit alcohol dehydrogenase family)
MACPHFDGRFVVTGGASGIGLAVARLAVAHGARVALLDRDAQALAGACAALGPSCEGFTCDVTDPAAVNAAVESAVQWLGGLDAVVNSAGVDAVVPLGQTTDAQWFRAMAVNLNGPMFVCRACLPHLKRAGGGSIVNVASGAALSPLRHRTAYCASKAALVMFGKALAIEAADDHIRVNAVCPGAVDTPLFRTSYEDAADPAAELEKIRERYAMKRVADPAEIAEAVLFLASPAASYITGTALAVDGGRTFH